MGTCDAAIAVAGYSLEEVAQGTSKLAGDGDTRCATRQSAFSVGTDRLNLPDPPTCLVHATALLATDDTHTDRKMGRSARW